MFIALLKLKDKEPTASGHVKPTASGHIKNNCVGACQNRLHLLYINLR